MQPIGALENHLRHLMGNTRLASRAVRETVARLIEPNPDLAKLTSPTNQIPPGASTP